MWINFNFHNFWQWASNCKWISTLHNNMNDAYLQIETVVMFSLINEAQITNALPIPIIVRIFTKKDRKNYTYTSSSETFPAFCPILLTLPSFAAPRSVACNGIKTVNFIHIERSRTWERERETRVSWSVRRGYWRCWEYHWRFTRFTWNSCPLKKFRIYLRIQFQTQ